MALKSARNLFALHKTSHKLSLFVHRDAPSSSSALLVEKSYYSDENHFPTTHRPLLLDRPLRKNSIVKALQSHRSKVALVEQNEEFLYEDILRRSLDLALIIKDLFKYESKSTDHKICFLCSNGLSFLLATLACWLSGNTAVPLSVHHGDNVYEHALSQNSSPFVIVTSEYRDRIRSQAKANNRQIVVLDSSWTRNAVKSFNSESPLPFLFKESFYHGDRNGLVLYTAGTSYGTPKPVTLNHYVIDSRIKKTVDAWGLSGEDVTLHALPAHNHFAILDAFLAPMSAGGKVLSLNTLDPTKIWSHLLGIGLNSSQMDSKANFFPSVPHVYSRLLENHQDLFHNRKVRDYVKSSCTKKIRSMVCGAGSLPLDLKNKWKGMTGHTIVETYTKTQVGTVFCSNVLKPQLATKAPSKSSPDYYSPLPGTEFCVVRFLDTSRTKYDVLSDNPEENEGGVIGELLLRNAEDTLEEADTDGWFSTRDIVRLRNGKVQIIGKILHPSLKRFRSVERQFTRYSGILDCFAFGFENPGVGMSLAVALVIDPNLEKSAFNAILTDYKNNNSSEASPALCRTLADIPLDSSGRVNKLQIAESAFQGKTLPKLYFEDYVL